MAQAAETDYEKIDASPDRAEHVHDLIQEMNRRLEAIQRLDQYTTTAEGHAFVQEFWRSLKYQEEDNIKELKRLLADETRKEPASA